MAVCDTYVELKSESKQILFTELFELKAQKKVIEDAIKKLESQYKPMVAEQDNDLFFSLPNGIKFSIKKSIRRLMLYEMLMVRLRYRKASSNT
jgi:cell division protein FtsB